jgi:hypothetical protein
MLEGYVVQGGAGGGGKIFPMRLPSVLLRARQNEWRGPVQRCYRGGGAEQALGTCGQVMAVSWSAFCSLQALVRERMQDWGKGLCGRLGKRLVELTGDYTPDLRQGLSRVPVRARVHSQDVNPPIAL